MTSAVATQSTMGQCFVLDDVAWDIYESVLQGVGNQHVVVTFESQGKSRAFPSASISHLQAFLEKAQSMDDTTWVRQFRQAVRAGVLPLPNH